jgi:hypothetical protein
MIGMTVFRTMSHEFACLAVLHGAERARVSVHRLHIPSGLDSLRRLPVPRQQLIESIDRVSIDRALEHVAQVLRRRQKSAARNCRQRLASGASPLEAMTWVEMGPAHWVPRVLFDEPGRDLIRSAAPFSAEAGQPWHQRDCFEVP